MIKVKSCNSKLSWSIGNGALPAVSFSDGGARGEEIDLQLPIDPTFYLSALHLICTVNIY